MVSTLIMFRKWLAWPGRLLGSIPVDSTVRGFTDPVVADIKFPREYDKDVDINTVISEILENLSATFAMDRTKRTNVEALIPGQPELSGPAIYAPVAAIGPVAERAQQQRVEQDQESRSLARRGHAAQASPESRRLSIPTESENGEAKMIPPSVVIEMDVRLKDIKASMPIFTRELSYSTYAFARPIVAFMNAHKTLIPVNCRIVMDLVRRLSNPRVNLTDLWISLKLVFSRSFQAGFTKLLPTMSHLIRPTRNGCAT